MIRYEITKTGHSELTAMGNVETLCADTMVLIKRLYDSLKEGPGEVLAEHFLKTLVHCLTDKNSPLYVEAGKK